MHSKITVSHREQTVFSSFPLNEETTVTTKLKKQITAIPQKVNKKKEEENGLPLKCFGQQTNSTPENNEIPQGKSIAKLRICIPRS